MTGQNRGICFEDPTTPNVRCETDADCEAGRVDLLGNGVQVSYSLLPCRTVPWNVFKILFMKREELFSS